MNIKTFSRLTGLSSHTLRYYEKIGLINANRDSKGHRDFSQTDLKWIECIKRLKSTNMSLNDIKAFASMRHQCLGPDYARLKILENHQARLDEQKKLLLLNQEKIEQEIKLYKKWNNISSP